MWIPKNALLIVVAKTQLQMLRDSIGIPLSTTPVEVSIKMVSQLILRKRALLQISNLLSFFRGEFQERLGKYQNK
jgi:hypothetical protein